MTKPRKPKRPADDERDRILAELEKALQEAQERNKADEVLIEDQRQRLKTLGLGRERSMRAVADSRRPRAGAVTLLRLMLRPLSSAHDTVNTEADIVIRSVNL